MGAIHPHSSPTVERINIARGACNGSARRLTAAAYGRLPVCAPCLCCVRRCVSLCSHNVSVVFRLPNKTVLFRTIVKTCFCPFRENPQFRGSWWKPHGVNETKRVVPQSIPPNPFRARLIYWSRELGPWPWGIS